MYDTIDNEINIPKTVELMKLEIIDMITAKIVVTVLPTANATGKSPLVVSLFLLK